MRRPALVSLVLSTLCLALAGCRAHGTQGVQECAAVDTALPADASLSGLEGEYRLTMVAVDSGDSDASAAGSLVLVPNDSAHVVREAPDTAMPGVRHTHYGWTDLSLDGLGALELGDLGSEDPDAPGVLVIENRQPRDGGTYLSVTLRFGSLANRLSAARFDEGYTALYVRQMTPGGFAGAWSSGKGQGRTAEGHFCAWRESE